MTVTQTSSTAEIVRNDQIDRRAIDTIRFLAADMVEEASSGHPGLPMGAAPMAWVLFSRHLKHDPTDSGWPDRDRFVLSAGHGSALQYCLLHMFGYDLPMAQLKQFRQLESATPGHPEVSHTDGVETTTGPLGQGLATAVGMALAERMLAARYPEITDHHTYVLAGDGCLMEGVSHEAGSLAGHLRLGRLIVLYDDNQITIDGGTDQAVSDDALARFASYGWHVDRIPDGTDRAAIDDALTAAKADPRPSLIAVRTVIGHGAPGIEGTPKAHGAPLGAEALATAKANAGWDHEPFTVPDDVREHCATLAARGGAAHGAWDEQFDAFADEHPERAAEWTRAQWRGLPDELETALAEVEVDQARATRQASQAVLRAAGSVMPELVGGSADLAGSTGTATGQPVVTAEDHSGSVLHFGVREFAMAAALNGLSLHGGFRPYGSTFLVFSDYLRPALRLSALMNQPVIYILTHDSIAVGEDGPTHQPVEHIEALRVIPGLRVLRPADDHETLAAWRTALERTDGPTALILSRQKVPSLGRPAETRFLSEDGARVVRNDIRLTPSSPTRAETVAPDVDLLATGAEVGLALEAADRLATEGVSVRVISVPWRERFAEVRHRLGEAPVTLSVEAGVRNGWTGLAPHGQISVEEFGASGPGDAVLARYGFTPEAVADHVRAVLANPQVLATGG